MYQRWSWYYQLSNETFSWLRVCLLRHVTEIYSPHPFLSVVPYFATLPNLQPYIKTPILLFGDFNIDITQNKAQFKFLKENFNLDSDTESSTMLSNTRLNLTLARNHSSESVPHISYILPLISVKQMYNKHCVQSNANFHSFNIYHARQGQKTYSRQNSSFSLNL
jgi:hypothetical protein